MCEIDVHRDIGAAPDDTGQVLVSEEGVRSDQHAAGAEEAVVGEPAKYPRVLRDRGRAAERFGRARERLQVLGGGTVNGVGMRPISAIVSAFSGPTKS